MNQATPSAATDPSPVACALLLMLRQQPHRGRPGRIEAPAAGLPRRAARASRWLVLALAALAAPPLHAERPLWELGMGLGTLRVPHYRGSEQSHNWVLPVPYVIYRGDILRSDRDGARAQLLKTERVDFDLSLGAGPPASSGDNRARAGMPDLAPTLEFGPKLNLHLGRGPGWRLDLRLPLRAAFTVRRPVQRLGWVSSPVLNLDLQRGGWNLGLQGGPQFASRRNHAYFYDVEPAFATATRPAYQSEGGYAGWGITTAASRRAGDWWLAAFVRVDSLAGARIASSPLVTQRQNISLGLAASWIFAVSDVRVDDRP